MREIIIILFFSLLGTIVMIFLGANERLYLFTQIYPIWGFNEFIVFFPAFMALGFVLFSAKRIQELRSEIKKREKAEETLRDSEKRFRELSITDELTGLFNSRFFFEKLRVELDRADRYSKPLSLVLLDIDDFKNYNDKYGHLEGDQVLIEIGQTIQSCMRGADSAYRYGGEEFVMLLPDTRGKGAAILAERVRKKFKTHIFSPKPGEDVHMTISIGVAEYGSGEEKDALIRRADMNMYTAKKKGKDQVFFSIK